MNNYTNQSRLQNLLQLMLQYKVDIVALNPGPTLTYLTGLQFHLMERPTVLLISKEHQPLIILPELEMAKLVDAQFYLETVPFNDDPSTWQETFEKAFKHLNIKKGRIGLESTRMRYLEVNLLQTAAPEAVFLSADEVFGNLRIQKDEGEINDMRRAVAIAQQALKATLPIVKAGLTEKEIAAHLTIELLRAGSDPELPFSPIVSSGPNSANPHATPTERQLEIGDLLVIDWGARSNGYCSDLTRTFAIGEIATDLQLVYKTVQEANAAGRAAGKPGVVAGKVDQASRRVIAEAGFGKYFTHRTGHGLGLEGHETPYIYAESQVQLTPAMTYTIEPGIYLPDYGGVRIEDDMLVSIDGSESLSDFSRELMTL